MSHTLEGDETDFSQEPQRGRSTKPNDFFSYFVTEEDAEHTEYLLTVHRDDIPKVRPFVASVLCQLPAMGDFSTYLVALKVGVNTGKIKDIVEERPGSSFGSNRRVTLA